MKGLRKKTTVTICIVLLTLADAGCGINNDSNKKNGISFQNEVSIDNLSESSSPARQYSEGEIGLLEGNDTIYWYDATTCLMNYLDESDMSWHVLCGKPDCSHTVEAAANNAGHVSDCNAFIERLFYTPLGYYNGRIYYVEGVVTLSDRWISSIKVDGTDHRRETKIEYQQNPAGTQYYFHYGRLYVLNCFFDKDTVVSIYTLNDLKRKDVTLDGYADPLYPKGQYIYYSRNGLDDWSVYTEKIMDLNGEDTGYQFEHSIASIGMYYSDDALYEFEPEKGLYKIEYSSKKETVLWNDMASYGIPYFYLFCDGKYIYLRASGEEIYTQGDQHLLLVFDMDGNMVREMNIVNTDEAREELKEKISQETDEKLKAQYKNYYAHITGDGTSSGYDAFYGSIGGYIFSGNYAMPNQYIRVEELTSGSEAPQWKDTIFVN